MAAGEEGGESGKVSLPHSKGHNKGEALMIRAERKMIHLREVLAITKKVCAMTNLHNC
jgi:hypothetical protein